MSLSKPAKVYFQAYKASYISEFPCIKKSSKGIKFVFCDVCRRDFNISHGGRNDVSRHVNGTMHQNNVTSAEKTKKVSSYFQNDLQLEVTKAELLFTSFLVEHNMPISAADHAGPLFRKMFPKIEIVKQYGSARTKTTALIGEMAADKTSNIVNFLKTGPFSVATDGSNNTDAKFYPVVVTFFDPVENAVRSTLLSLPNLQGDSTGSNIADLIIKEFENRSIPFEHCLAFSADNANVMMGHKNGVIRFLKEKNENLIGIGCCCHLINLAAEKGAATLPSKVEDILIDIYYYLNKSAKRKEALQKFQELYDTEAQKILKHVCTRWLSLGRSLKRLIAQWDPLTSLFKEAIQVKKHSIPNYLKDYDIPKLNADKRNVKNLKCDKINRDDKHEKSKVKLSEKERKTEKKFQSASNSSSSSAIKRKSETFEISSKKTKMSKYSGLTREESIFMFLTSPIDKAYCLFLCSIIPTFEKTNIQLQSSSPLIHILRDILLDLLRELYCKFLKPVAVKNKDLIEVDFNSPSCYKNDEEIVISKATQDIVLELSEEDKQTFYAAIKEYFVASCNYIVQKFPLKSDILINAEVANIKKIENASFSSVLFFVDRFAFLLEESENKSVAADELQKEFCRLQLEDLSSIIDSNQQIDKQWAKILEMKSADGLFKYQKISKVMLSILLLPHSNAECERIFSVVRKNRSESRSLMSNQTLENLMILKTQSSKPCYEQVFSEELLKRAKKATAASLTQVPSSS